MIAVATEWSVAKANEKAIQDAVVRRAIENPTEQLIEVTEAAS